MGAKGWAGAGAVRREADDVEEVGNSAIMEARAVGEEKADTFVVTEAAKWEDEWSEVGTGIESMAADEDVVDVNNSSD